MMNCPKIFFLFAFTVVGLSMTLSVLNRMRIKAPLNVTNKIRMVVKSKLNVTTVEDNIRIQTHDPPPVNRAKNAPKTPGKMEESLPGSLDGFGANFTLTDATNATSSDSNVSKPRFNDSEEKRIVQNAAMKYGASNSFKFLPKCPAAVAKEFNFPIEYPLMIHTLPEISNVTAGDAIHYFDWGKMSGNVVSFSNHSYMAERLVTKTHMSKMKNSGGTFTLLPAWGKHKPKFLERVPNHWARYSTAIFSGNTLCFEPSQKKFSKFVSNITPLSWNSNVARKNATFKTVMIASDFLDGFFHASRVMNAWCVVKDEPIRLLLQTSKGDEAPLYIQRFAEIMGVSDKVIVQGRNPIFAENVLIAPRQFLNWSCMRDVAQKRFKIDESVPQDRVVLIYRVPSWRAIPKTIHEKLEEALSEAFPSLTVITFKGDESLLETVDLFSRARIVIGPHGAAMVNLVFSKSGIPVVEYLFPSIMGRSMEFNIGASIGMQWWPVQVGSFDNETEILNTVPVAVRAVMHSDSTLSDNSEHSFSQ